MCRGSSLHGAVCLSESSSANSSDKLSVPQPGSHVTTGGLSIEHVEEIPRFQFGSLDQFDWFKVFIVGFITGPLELRIEALLPVPAEVVDAKISVSRGASRVPIWFVATLVFLVIAARNPLPLASEDVLWDARRASRWTLVTVCRTQCRFTKLTLGIAPSFVWIWLAVIPQSI